MAASRDPLMKISRRSFLHRRGRGLRDAVSAAIAAADPIRLLELGAPGDEYDPEVALILPRLPDARASADVRRIVREVFARKFGEDVAGPEERYEAVAAAIWQRLHTDAKTSG